jgi:hypothetical protein
MFESGSARPSHSTFVSVLDLRRQDAAAFVSGVFGPGASLPLASQLFALPVSSSGSSLGCDHAATLASPTAPLKRELGAITTAKGFEPNAHRLLRTLGRRFRWRKWPVALAHGRTPTAVGLATAAKTPLVSLSANRAG